MAAKPKFNLVDLLSQRSKQQEEEEREPAQEPKEENVQQDSVFMVDVYDMVPSKDNFYHVDADLKRSIELVGVLQPCVVKKPVNGKYSVIAGHRRRLASIALVEEGKKKYRYIPCMYKKAEVEDELAIIMANSFRGKTDFEKMTEIIRIKELVKDMKKEYKLPGRVRAMQRELTGITEAQISRYETIYNNLQPELMEEFRKNRINFSVSVEIASFEEKWQVSAYNKLLENGELSLSDVRKMKKQIEEESQMPEEEPSQEEEWTDPEPETIDSICYSCTKYETCHEKKVSVSKCNAYQNRKEAGMTEEERYEKQQSEIDRETKRKLEEIKQDEKMEPLQSGRKRKYVRVSKKQYMEIEDGHKPYIILKTTEHLKQGDIITAQVFEAGRATGEITDLYITGMDDENTSSAINSGYVIAGVVKKEVAEDLGLLEDMKEGWDY